MDGVIRLAVDKDSHPQLLLHNLSPLLLYFGEASVAEAAASSSAVLAASGGRGFEVKESRELVNRLPTLDPFNSTYYSFPALHETFPSLDADLAKTVRLHFAAAAAATSPKRSLSGGDENADERLASISKSYLNNTAGVEEAASELGKSLASFFFQFFVRDGIEFRADYNSTLCGVVVVIAAAAVLD